MKKIFGTDGVRGRAGTYPITSENVYKLGYLFATIARIKETAVAWDTRESSLWIANSLISGLNDAGVSVSTMGCIPTPVLSYLTKEKYESGIMITASHNPYTDNGLKFFDFRGEKISDELENEITKEIEKTGIKVSIKECIENLFFLEKTALSTYFNNLKEKINLSIIQKLYPIDCANGATSLFIKLAEKELGLKFNPYNISPDGKNINLNCGAAQPEYIKENSFAFDGDGDRIIGKDKHGKIINGDIILMFLAEKLKLNKVIGTVMTNVSAENFFRKKGIEFYRTKVGDRFVKEMMNKTKARLGGETSGHIILTDLNSTGDGFAIYLKLHELLNTEKITLEKLAEKYKLSPQKVINIKVKEKKPFDKIKGFKEMIKKCEIIVGDKGRIFPRYSGTENLLRILVECQEIEKLNKVEKTIKEFFNITED